MRVSGVPYEQGNTHGPLHPIAVVLHRTYGGYAGSKGVAFGSAGIGFHFLIGKQPGQVVQLADTAQKCWHAAGGNSWSVGIEFEGRNEDALTGWQVEQAAQIISAVAAAHAIPLDWMPPNAGRPPPAGGIRGHVNVPGSNHTDYVTAADWQRIVAAMGGARLPEDDMFEDRDRQAIEDLRHHVLRLEQLVTPRVTQYVGAAVIHDVQQEAFTDSHGTLWRLVRRDTGVTYDRLAEGCVPNEWAIIEDGTRPPLSRWGEFLACISRRASDGASVRVVWTPAQGFRAPEIGEPAA